MLDIGIIAANLWSYAYAGQVTNNKKTEENKWQERKLPKLSLFWCIIVNYTTVYNCCVWWPWCNYLDDQKKNLIPSLHKPISIISVTGIKLLYLFTTWSKYFPRKTRFLGVKDELCFKVGFVQKTSSFSIWKLV